jgi:gas vesicle protein
MSDNNNGNGNGAMGGMLAAFAIGALVGGAAALLLAPRSGRETRELLAKKGKDLSDAARDTLTKGTGMLRDTGHRLTEAMQAGKKAVDEVKTEVRG